MYAILCGLCLEDTSLRSRPIYAACYRRRMIQQTHGEKHFNLANEPHRRALRRGLSSGNNQSTSSTSDTENISQVTLLLNTHVTHKLLRNIAKCVEVFYTANNDDHVK